MATPKTSTHPIHRTQITAHPGEAFLNTLQTRLDSPNRLCIILFVSFCPYNRTIYLHDESDPGIQPRIEPVRF
jgi:hypothetical protein